ncbi:GerAB/ArcD/ProY family transporter [Paenibacillus ginsengihumi]|uniref:GerAB/ArcD/ProY family transporter n=1 Tax=Paenibacillus ginsengihumi TaxID=431596 RepID=UPI000370DB46|nr:endospore germination permease [Paenibacillus ginsengihumi]
MKAFQYGDDQISSKEISFATASVIIAVFILVLPRTVAKDTGSIDGWIAIVLAGCVNGVFAWLMATLCARFPQQTFFVFSARLVSKPVAYVMTIALAAYLMTLVSYEVRLISETAKLYLLGRTPLEFIALAFLLLTVYAVFSSEVTILRLNLLFVPIIAAIVIIVLVSNIGYMEMSNVKPAFITSWERIWGAVKNNIWAFSGYEIILVYIAYVKEPSKVAKAVVGGMCVPFVLYIAVYIVAIAVFSVQGAENMVFPTIELAKQVEVPGEFFSRFESIFFTVWVLTIFTTTTMALDAAVKSLRSMFPRLRKPVFLSLSAPLIYILAMMPENLNAAFALGSSLTYPALFYTMLVPTLLLLVAKWTGIRGT